VYAQEREIGWWPMKQKVIPLVQMGVGVRDSNDAERSLLLTAGFATAECCHCCCHCHHHHCCCYCWESNHCAGLHIQKMTSNYIINIDQCSQNLSIYKLSVSQMFKVTLLRTMFIIL
jgi:hypothetical protein